MEHQRPHNDIFSDASEQLPGQFYLIDAPNGEYGHYSALSGYSPSNNSSVGAGSVQPGMQTRHGVVSTSSTSTSTSSINSDITFRTTSNGNSSISTTTRPSTTSQMTFLQLDHRRRPRRY
ncbi:hypothetical protein V2A60_006918 [Cordyceps javanica]